MSVTRSSEEAEVLRLARLFGAAQSAGTFVEAMLALRDLQKAARALHEAERREPAPPRAAR